MSETDEFELDLSGFVIKSEELGLPQFLLWYGPYGGGKTRLALSASEVEGLYPMLVIDTEGSTTGVIDQFDKSRIDVIRPAKQWPNAPWQKTVSLLNNLLKKTHKYKTVVIDAADVLLDWGLQELHEPGDGFAKWNKIHSALTESNKEVGQGLFFKLKDADFLTILVVHEKKEGGTEDSLPFADFLWSGQGRSKLGGIPDIVGYVTRDTNSAGESVSTLQTAPTKKNNAKTRYALPAKMAGADMAKIYDIITNTKETK